jgi:hypothetical protein
VKKEIECALEFFRESSLPVLERRDPFQQVFFA